MTKLQMLHRDPILAGIMRQIATNRWSGSRQYKHPYKQVWHRLTVHDGIVFNGETIVAPTYLCNHFVELAHCDHWGIKGTSHLLKMKAWWPQQECDITQFIDKCDTCAKWKRKHHYLHHWPEVEEAWSRSAYGPWSIPWQSNINYGWCVFWAWGHRHAWQKCGYMSMGYQKNIRKTWNTIYIGRW